jgi:hypothetical protein
MTAKVGVLGGEPLPGDEAGGRCLIRRKCVPCGEATVHAYLRDDPAEAEYRDWAEQTPAQQHEASRRRIKAACGWDMGPYRPEETVTNRQELRREMLEEVERLRACQFRVAWTRNKDWQADEVGRLFQFLDDGVFYIELNRAFAGDEHLRVLRLVWTVAMERSGAHWLVQSATLDDPDSVPYRATTFLAVSDDARH